LAEGKKNAWRRKAWIVFQDESGISLTPPLRRTWAPRGQTPVLRFHFNWKRLSMAAALAYRYDGATSRLVFATRAGAYNDASLIEFLIQLRRHLRGDKATLIWDGLPSHRSRAMRAFLATQRPWLVVERLPAYAPDLNPVEALWGNIKGTELANPCAENLDETLDAATDGIIRVRHRRLAFAFLHQAGLSL
jgi:transposase